MKRLIALLSLALVASQAQAVVVVARPVVMARPVIAARPAVTAARPAPISKPAAVAPRPAVVVPHVASSCTDERRKRKEC